MDEITLKLSKHAVFCLKIVTFAAERLLNRRFNMYGKPVCFFSTVCKFYIIQKTVTTMKKAYTKPTARVVALHARQQLLTVSGEISGYGKSSGGFSQDEGGSSNAPQSRGIWDND